MGIKVNQNIPIQIKADAYDQLCKAYAEGSRMDFSLFGRRKSGFNSVAEYVGYAFGKIALRNGSLGEEVQQRLEL